MPAIPTATRTCRKCGEIQPIDQFRRRRKEQPERASICRLCHNEQEVFHRLQRRLGRNAKLLSHFNWQLSKAESQRDAYRLVGAMVEKYGGVGGLAKALSDHVDTACERKPGGRESGNALRAVLRLSEHCQPEPLDTDLMDEADLQREFDQHVGELIEHSPELAIAAAHRLGWQVIPPAGMAEATT